MTNVKMKATDTLHISSVSQHNIQPGEEFEVSKHIADDLEQRGLASPVSANADEKPAASKEAKPQAKAKA